MLECGKEVRVKTLLLMASMGALVLASPARADPNTDDVHCFLVAIKMADSDQPAQKTLGLMGQFYWMGKLDGRMPGLDMETAVMAELPKMLGKLFDASPPAAARNWASAARPKSTWARIVQARRREIEAGEAE